MYVHTSGISLIYTQFTLVAIEESVCNKSIGVTSTSEMVYVVVVVTGPPGHQGDHRPLRQVTGEL